MSAPDSRVVRDKSSRPSFYRVSLGLFGAGVLGLMLASIDTSRAVAYAAAVAYVLIAVPLTFWPEHSTDIDEQRWEGSD